MQINVTEEETAIRKEMSETKSAYGGSGITRNF